MCNIYTMPKREDRRPLDNKQIQRTTKLRDRRPYNSQLMAEI